MLGWLADFFRLWWGLIYWNTRKTWFQWRRGRSACPCQSPSDSGRAFETNCEACIPWAKPGRFRRVCPLLVETKDGLRCSADTAQVRPFWGRAFGYYGGVTLSLYLIGAIGVFIFLRSVGYPVSIVHVTLPPLWHRVMETRGWYFLNRAEQALAAGDSAQGILYLASAYEFDPKNYRAGITLAKHLQASQPGRSDLVFEQLLREHPTNRSATAQDWFRALLPRGDFDKIATLARSELAAGSEHASVWLRALLFATRQTGKEAPLREILDPKSVNTRRWHGVVELELLVREGKRAEALALVARPLPDDAPVFTIYHRIDALIDLKEYFTALDLIGKYSARLASDPQAYSTLLLDGYAAAGSRQLVPHFEAMLRQPLNPALISLLCAHLIRHPNPQAMELLWRKFGASPLPLTTENAGAWFSLLCATGAVGDKAKLHEVTARLRQASTTPFYALAAVEAFFRGEINERRINVFLPILPLPIDVTYALYERYPLPAALPSEPPKRK